MKSKQDDIINLIDSKGGSVEDSWQYINSTNKFWITCHKGHRWQTCWNVIQSNHWCPNCAKERNYQKNLDSRVPKNKIREFIESKEAKLDPEWKYINNQEKFWVECKYGHRWQAIWNNLRRGHWCPHCTGKLINEKDIRTYIKGKGGNLSNNWSFKTSKTKFSIVCKNGHSFEGCWDKIRLGHWCPFCYGNNKPDEIKIINIVNSKKGTLDADWKYENAYTKFWITCHKGHRWQTIWPNLRTGHWCPNCKESKAEKTFCKFLENTLSAEFPKQKPSWLKNPLTGRLLELDGYNQNLSLAFEYQGCFHYYNPYDSKNIIHTENQKQRDNIKAKLCQQNGVTLIVMPYWIPKNNWKNEIDKILNSNKG